MAGSAEGGVDLEAAGTRGENLYDLACHHRQVPYLLFGAPLERAGDGIAVDRRVERVLETHQQHLEPEPIELAGQRVGRIQALLERPPPIRRPDFDVIPGPNDDRFSSEPGPIANGPRQNDSALAVALNFKRT